MEKAITIKTPSNSLNDVSVKAMEDEKLEEFKNPTELYQDLGI
ncbi:MAG: hypothetical protein ACI86H_001817 [bacterium]|jgi:hypothetical protein